MKDGERMSRYINADDFFMKMYNAAYPVIHGNNEREAGLTVYGIAQLLDEQPTVPATKWIPFKMRKPDQDELEEHPYWTYVLDGQLPDEGQRILVNCVFKGHEAVQLDEFYTDADGCYLDSGYEIGTEVSAWMPLPEPYKMDEVTK